LKVAVIGVPMDLGANRRGVDMGPSAIRYADLIPQIKELKIGVKDYGDLEVPIIRHNKERENYILAIRDTCSILAKKVKRSLDLDYLPLILGGDHSITIGTFKGLKSVNQDVGLIWFDAHADFNTPGTSQTGNIHGMSLAVINGEGPDELISILEDDYGIDEENIALIGVRDLDASESRRLKETDINIYTISDIDRLGIEQVMKEAIEIASCDKEGVHVSFDIDVLDPLTAPGVGTAVPGGLNYREAHLAMEMIADAGTLISMDLVEVNPILDERNRTAKVGVDLILSALGKQIL